MKYFSSILLLFLLLTNQNVYGQRDEDKVYQMKWSRLVYTQPDDWYKSEQAKSIAENVLLYQRNTGGWPKNIAIHMPLTEEEQEEVHVDKKRTDDSTIDNDATFLEICYLAKIYNATEDIRYKDAFQKGVQYLIEAQYENGGWPQFYPLRKGYYSHITYNDNAMVNTMLILRSIAQKEYPYTSIVVDSVVEKSSNAFNKGVECILNTQYVQKGKLTVWCAQHDEFTLAPAKARSYELPSLSAGESVQIVKLLMNIENPSERMKSSVMSAVRWFDENRVKGIKLERFKNEEGIWDRRVVEDKNAPDLWGRFCGLDDNRPFFCDRDGVMKYSLAEIGHERRNYYRWYCGEANELFLLYHSWLKKNNLSNN
ncbi:MAG: pectate lyase [Prevotellaceae bacterium]|jgi:pectinesterase|nr:pectate lyase [Prevotellaceae bacterium]